MIRTIWKSKTHNARIVLNQFLINPESSKRPFRTLLGNRKRNFETEADARAWLAKQGVTE